MTELEKIGAFIGNTPLAEIVLSYKGECKTLYAKMEYYNLAGSVKDRIAYRMLKKAYQEGSIKPGDAIVEATSGNTGIAFCAIGAYLGHPVIIFMPDWMSEERKKLIRSFGAEIRLVSREEGGFLGSIEKAEALAKEMGSVYLPRQFSNEDNSLAQYEGLGQELLADLEALNLVPGGLVAGVGTGGTVMGVGRALREVNKRAKIYPLEPLESPTLSTGYKVGSHRIAGISDDFVPDLVKLDKLNEVVSISDGDAIIMAQKMAQKGIGIGISAGANLLGALKKVDEVGGEMVTIFPDDNKKYLSTDLMESIPMKEEYMTKDIEILEIRAHRPII